MSTYLGLMPIFHLAYSALIVKVLEGAYNKDKALVGAFFGHFENFADLRFQLLL